MITAPTKNNASPLAAIPIRGTPIPISNPTAPAASSTPKMGSHDFGIPNLLMLPRSHFGRMKSLIATDVLACDKHISIHLCSTTDMFAIEERPRDLLRRPVPRVSRARGLRGLPEFSQNRLWMNPGIVLCKLLIIIDLHSWP